MRQELDDALVRDFPMLYSDRRGDMRSTCMCWGFECGDGWHDLIRELSVKLETIIASLPEADRGLYRAAQVKQKFGGLRFYMTLETQEMSDAIADAENRSLDTCEVCGAAGKRRGGGWIETLCDHCFEDREAERARRAAAYGKKDDE